MYGQSAEPYERTPARSKARTKTEKHGEMQPWQLTAKRDKIGKGEPYHRHGALVNYNSVQFNMSEKMALRLKRALLYPCPANVGIPKGGRLAIN